MTLICPDCGSVLRKHSSNEGLCVFGHGIFTLDESGKGVIAQPVRTKAIQQRLRNPGPLRPYQLRVIPQKSTAVS